MKDAVWVVLAAMVCGVAIGCGGTGTIVIGKEADANFSSDVLKACSGAKFELLITQQDLQGNDVPPDTTTGTVEVGSIQFAVKNMDFGRPVALTLKLLSGKCDIDPVAVTGLIPLAPVPNKKDVYSVDLSRFHKP